MKRIMIIGCSGSGKSTLASKLASKTGLPLLHLDQFFWSEGWTKTPDRDWELEVERLASGDRWIIDGNYSRTFGPRIERADTIIFLDRSTLSCLRRVIARTIRYYGRVRPGIPAGCPERFDLHFLLFVLSYNRMRRPKILAALAAAQEIGKTVIKLKTDREVTDFLSGLAE